MTVFFLFRPIRLLLSTTTNHWQSRLMLPTPLFSMSSAYPSLKYRSVLDLGVFLSVSRYKSNKWMRRSFNFLYEYYCIPGGWKSLQRPSNFGCSCWIRARFRRLGATVTSNMLNRQFSSCINLHFTLVDFFLIIESISCDKVLNLIFDIRCMWVHGNCLLA